jgi:hypothetical protein
MVNSIALFYYNRHYNYYLIYVPLILLPHQHHLVTLDCDPTSIGVVTLLLESITPQRPKRTAGAQY